MFAYPATSCYYIELELKQILLIKHAKTSTR